MSGAWVDLAQPLYTGMPAPGASGIATFDTVTRPVTTTSTLSVTHISMAVHTGTHIDAARHFIPNGRSIDEYPASTFCGPGVILNVAREGMVEVTAGELESVGEQVASGDIVFLSFGYGQFFGTERYKQHPYLAIDAARWLREREVKMVCVDIMTPDRPEGDRPDGFSWPVHQVLLGADIPIMENVHPRVAEWVGRRVDVLAHPVPIRGADGGPVVPLVRLTDIQEK